MSAPASYQIELFPLADIRPTERHFEDHAENLRTEIAITGVWTKPLLVDRDRAALMDGHHRYHAARALGLVLVPVIRLSYADPAVALKSWRPGERFTPQDIWDLCDSGKLLPMKTTRHVISAQLPFSRVPLEDLADPARGGTVVPPAAPHPSRVQILAEGYHRFGARMGLRTVSAANLDVETPETLVPHHHLRKVLESDPAMAALMPAAPCRIALGRQGDFPFRLAGPDLLLVPPGLLESAPALAAAIRWGMEAAFALQAGAPGPRRLAGLLRHGARLVAGLPAQERALLVAQAPGGAMAELTGTALRPPSPGLLAWMAERIGIPAPAASETAPDQTLPLESPVEAVLVSNSDSRLRVDPATGKNKYGTTPRPRPEAVHFSSSTASSISDYGFLYCDVLRRDLLNHVLDTGAGIGETRRALCQSIVEELVALCGLPEGGADGVIAPSGTDTELLAVMLARAAAPGTRLVNILIAPAETGRGVALAGAGRWFDDQSATGAAIAKGDPVWPEAEIELAEIPLRDADGACLPPATVDAQFLAAGRAALDSGARVLAHVLIGSKTGLDGPRFAAAETLQAEAPDRVDLVVDACQMRGDPAVLGQCLARGWMVQVSGSKSLTGPPFSGALLVPAAYRARAAAVHRLMRPGLCYPEDWSGWWAGRLGHSAAPPAFGAPMRWLPALLELRLLEHVPEALRAVALDRFRREVSERLAHSPVLTVLPDETGAGDDPDRPPASSFARHSIMAFEVKGAEWDGRLRPLDEPACRTIFELLNRDASRLIPTATPAERGLLSQQFHIGQPVVLGSGANRRTVLRLVIGMRFYNIIAHAGPGSVTAALESEISDLLRAIDKLEILARNWWSYRRDLA